MNLILTLLHTCVNYPSCQCCRPEIAAESINVTAVTAASTLLQVLDQTHPAQANEG